MHIETLNLVHFFPTLLSKKVLRKSLRELDCIFCKLLNFFLGTSGRALQYAEHTEEFHSAYAVFGLMGAALVILAVILCVDVPQDNDVHCRA